MKFFLVPILMILVLSLTFGKWLVVAEYNMNRDFIVKNLCINKAKPKMHCNGKCQMMKRLAEEDKQNTSGTNNNSAKTKVYQIVFSNEINKPALAVPAFARPCYNEIPPVLECDSPVSTVFHPPAMC